MHHYLIQLELLITAKGSERCSEKQIEKKETAELELLMEGPGTFPLERLLAIFECIASVAEISTEEDNSSLASESKDSVIADSCLMLFASYLVFAMLILSSKVVVVH